MKCGKKFIVILQSLFVGVILVSTVHAGKSVYVITTGDQKVLAYKADANSLTYQTDYDVNVTSCTGIATDESEYGNYLFITFEGANSIQLVDAKSMQYVDTVIAPQRGRMERLR